MFNTFPVGSKCRTYENEVIDPSSLFDFNYEDKSKFSKKLQSVFGSPTLPTFDNRNIVIHCQSPLAGEKGLSRKNSLSSILNFSKFLQSSSKSEIFSSTPSKNSPGTNSTSTIGNKHVNTSTRSPANEKNLYSSKFRSDAPIQSKSFNGLSNSPWLNNNVKSTFCSPQSVKSIKEVVNEAIGGKCKDLVDNAVNSKSFLSRETRLESIPVGSSEDLTPPTSTNISSDIINLPQCCKKLFPNSSRPDEVISCTDVLSELPAKNLDDATHNKLVSENLDDATPKLSVVNLDDANKLLDENLDGATHNKLLDENLDDATHNKLLDENLDGATHNKLLDENLDDATHNKLLDENLDDATHIKLLDENLDGATHNKLLDENLDDATHNKLLDENLDDATHNKLLDEHLNDASHNILLTENLDDATHNKLVSENLDDATYKLSVVNLDDANKLLDENLDDATHNKLLDENLDDATHNKLLDKNLDDATHNKLLDENLDDATHNKLLDENLDDATHNKLLDENLDDATHNKLLDENLDDATHNKLLDENLDDATHNKLLDENLDDATHNKLLDENLDDATHNKLLDENLDDATHNKLLDENLDDATHNKLLDENLDDATHNKLLDENLDDATHNKLLDENLDDATHNKLLDENLDDATHNKLLDENLDDATHNKFRTENYDDATHKKLPTENLDDEYHNKFPIDNLDDVTHNKLPAENCDDASLNILPTENLDDATHNKLLDENLDDATHNKLPAENSDEASHSKLPTENLDDATHNKLSTENLYDASHNKLPVVNLGDANFCADYETKILLNPMAVTDNLSSDKILKPPTRKSTIVSFKLKNRSSAQSIKYFSSIGVIKPSFVKITRLSKNKKPKKTIKNSPMAKSTKNKKARQRKVTLPVLVKEPDQYILDSNLTSPNKTRLDVQPSKPIESECSEVMDSNINMESLIEDISSNESLDSKILDVDEGNAPSRDDGLDDVSVLEDILLDLSFVSDGDRRDLGMFDDELTLSSDPNQHFKNSIDCNTESEEVSKQSDTKSQITTSGNEDTTTTPSYNLLKSKPSGNFKDSVNPNIDSEDIIKQNCTVTPTSSNSTLKNSPNLTSLCTDSQTISTKSVTDCNSTLDPTVAILDSYLSTSTKGGRKKDKGPSLPPRIVAIENRIVAKYGPVEEKQRIETNQKINEGVIDLVNELCFDGPSHSSTIKSNTALSNEQLKASFTNTKTIKKPPKSSVGQCSKPKKVTLRRSIGLPNSAEGNFNEAVAVKRKCIEEEDDEKIESQPKRLRSVVFISDDADENRDNEHPDWQFYKCSTPEQVYSYIKERWHNSSAANPYVNLTTSRRRQFVKETEELQCSAKFLILKRSRDLLNEESGFKGKRSREENLNDNSSQPPSKRRKINEDEMEFSLTHARRCERAIHEDFTEVTSNWNSSKYKMEKIREDFNKKLHQVEIGYQEVRDICYFYSELFDFDQNSSMYRTEMEEIENLYGQFMEFYNWSGREFCSLHAEKN